MICYTCTLRVNNEALTRLDVIYGPCSMSACIRSRHTLWYTFTPTLNSGYFFTKTFEDFGKGPRAGHVYIQPSKFTDRICSLGSTFRLSS